MRDASGEGVDLIARARARFSLHGPASASDFAGCAERPEALRGDHTLNPGQTDIPSLGVHAKPAAVLIGLIARPEGARVLLTERSPALRAHSGQVAFPGGRIDSGDSDAIAAALRETHEEIGLSPEHIEPFGRMPPYLTGSGYRIVPIVAQIHPPFELNLNFNEVSEVFEAPLDFLLNPAHHARRSVEWNGALRAFYEMPWNGHRIWGVTAGILRQFYETMVDL